MLRVLYILPASVLGCGHVLVQLVWRGLMWQHQQRTEADYHQPLLLVPAHTPAIHSKHTSCFLLKLTSLSLSLSFLASYSTISCLNAALSSSTMDCRSGCSTLSPPTHTVTHQHTHTHIISNNTQLSTHVTRDLAYSCFLSLSWRV